MTLLNRTICLSVMAGMSVGLIGCETMDNNRAATGAVVGTVVGAGAGAAIDKRNRWRGGAIGGATGAVVGGGTGYVLQKDKQRIDRLERERY